MIETMRREGHTALVHTAAASNLGQMLNRICLADGIGLVNIVRKPEQEALLREQGAVHVVSTASPRFVDELTEALVATGATLAFDAIGGGKLAGQILGAMEAALNRTRQGVQPLRLDDAQAGLHLRRPRHRPDRARCATSAWRGASAAGCCSRSCSASARKRAQALKARVAAELTTTFASHYTRTVSLAGALAGRRDRRLRPARDGVEGADRSERVMRAAATKVAADAARPSARPPPSRPRAPAASSRGRTKWQV